MKNLISLLLVIFNESPIPKIFFRKKINIEYFDPNYTQYWRDRKSDSNRFRFSLNMKWWEKLLSPRYVKTRIVSRFIPHGANIADIGCGDGYMLSALRETRRTNGIGVDISASGLESVSEVGFKTVLCDLQDKESLNSVPICDYALMIDVIEHLKNPELAVIKVMEKAKYGVLINIPNSGNYIHILRLLFGKSAEQWMFTPDEHLRFWTVSDFKYWCKSLGLTVVRHKSVWGIPVLRELFPGLFSASHLYCVVKK